VAEVAANLQELGIPHWRASGRAWNERHPAFSLPEAYDVVFEPDAGILAAARAVAVQIELARFHGGDRMHVYDQCPVRRIDLDGTRAVVLTDSAQIVAERLIVSAGAWTKRLLPQLPVPLRVTRQQVLYFRAGDPPPFEIGRFPIFMFVPSGDQDVYYGMPEFLGMGVKVARHGGPEIDPDVDDRTVGDVYRSIVRRFLRRHIALLADAPIDRTEICLYTIAPDEQFQVDFLPGRSDVIIASPCSGHGFKFSCLIGRVLADLAMTGRTEVAIEAWKIRTKT
jgi:sarcosine oxidase